MASWEPMTLDQVTHQLSAGGNVPAELVEIYNEEAEEHLRQIYDALGIVSKNRNDLDALAIVRRSAHTLKGAAGAVGLEAVTRLSHRMEDLLDRLAENQKPVSKAQVKLLLNTTDRLQDLSGEYDVNSLAKQINKIYQQYSKELEALGESPAQPTAAGEPILSETISSQDELPTVVQRSPRDQRYLRVPVERLDDLVGLVSEMIVNRSAMEQRLSDYETQVTELFEAVDRLGRTGRELELKSNTRPLDRLVAASAGSSSDSVAKPGKLDSLEFDRYNEMNLMAMTLAENNSDVEILAKELHRLRGDFDGLVRKQRDLNRKTQFSLMQVRLVPFRGIVSRLERTVRTVSSKVGKSIGLEVTGDATELDKTVLDEIVDPLQHLLRNAIDHGVEDKKTRAAAGKPETARICIEAINQGTQVTIRISDDGGGINEEKVYNKALENGIITEDDLLSSDDLYNLIFTPGFSTAKELTDVSGRGVGMDVVREAIARLKGSIRVNSEAGVGTTFTIQLPTSVGVSRALLVRSGQADFAIPMQAIRKICNVQPEALAKTDEGVVLATIDGEAHTIRDLATHLQLSGKDAVITKVLPVLLVKVGNEETAFTVDQVIGGHDIIVKSLGSQFSNIPGILGATIRGDGSIVPILDPIDLVGNHSSIPPMLTPQPARTVKVSTAMVIDDSISVRRVTQSLLESVGWHVVTARDGVDALNVLEELENPPSVFLCDMEMPRMNGIELIKNLRQRNEFVQTPIVMVTSRASEKHRHMAFDAGATDYVVKPYNDEELLALIDELVLMASETVGA